MLHCGYFGAAVSVVTGGLLEVVVQHDVLGLVQVPSQLCDVISFQAVGAKNGTAARVGPKHFLLFNIKQYYS